MRILVADPDESFMGILKSHLSQRGHATIFASNEGECISILRKYQTEMLVLAGDLAGGDDVMTELNSNDNLSRLPVVLVSEVLDPAEPPSQRTALGWLRRPFRLSELDYKIEIAKVLWRLPDSQHTFPTGSAH